MATSTAAPWTILFSSAILKSAEKQSSGRPRTEGPRAGVSDRFVAPAIDPRVLRQLREQLTLERLLKAAPLNKDRAEVPLDLLYVDAARWDRLESSLEPASDDNERRIARREMEEWLRHTLFTDTRLPVQNQGQPFNRTLRADAYIARESMRLVAFVRIRQTAPTLADRWVKIPVELTTADGLVQVPERGFPSFALRPSFDEELKGLYGRLPAGFEAEMTAKLSKICGPLGFPGEIRDFGAVAELLAGVLDRYARGLTAEELATVRLYHRVYTRRGSYWGFETTPEMLKKLRAEEFSSLAELVRHRAAWSADDHLASLYLVMQKGFRDDLVKRLLARCGTPAQLVAPKGYQIIAEIIAELGEKDYAQLTDAQIAAIESHRFRFAKFGES